ncbi:DUF4168 domain-containing protein [Reichenbachiella agariperforans]|uniref:DUF4168 domain-containing protein n=1 Tax=Reichenbachiella agariperforans TaxID=156994 RepID=UPI001C09817A|nr:DUF4168 domain-containing protein [Reichenbachiella agariperforans]MBU2916181.1 DUF4168 domain-containing protein [Reichenbachiella agariperforans]
MKIRTVLSAVLLSMAVFVAQAQEEEITTEELTQYAKVMLSIDSMKVDLQAKTNDMVKNDPLMDMGRTFNAIKQANGDSAKLAAAEISPEQLAAYDSIQSNIEVLKANFKTNYTAAIKDDLGAGNYNKVKKALKADPALKESYDEIVATLQQPATEEQEG